MPFPEVKRVLYKKNPIDQVIFQAQFPAILKIEAEVPALLQEQIQDQFPELSEIADIQLQFPPNMPVQIPPEIIRQVIQSSTNKNYQFISSDKIWKINLTRSFLALTTTKYDRWENFKEHIKKPYQSLLELYHPISLNRIGLRYINVIRRSALGITDKPWNELISPHIACVLSPEETSSNIKSFDATYEIQLSEKNCLVKMNTKFVQAVDNGETCFMIDNDFYSLDTKYFTSKTT